MTGYYVINDTPEGAQFAWFASGLDAAGFALKLKLAGAQNVRVRSSKPHPSDARFHAQRAAKGVA